MTLLSNTAILRLREAGAIVIEPFSMEALGNVSYDLTLGDEVARYRLDAETDPSEPFDPSVDDPALLFRIVKAGPTRFSHHKGPGFLLSPGERVLARSREIAGGRQAWCVACEGTGDFRAQGQAREDCPVCRREPLIAVTTQLHATSTAARIGWQSCGCAGWGDVGFLSPWVFEVTNMSPRALWLPVGSVIAQVSFDRVEPIISGTSYEVAGTYQRSADPVELLKTWTLKDGLPKRLKVRP